MNIPLKQISKAKRPIRSSKDKQKMQELTDSIREYGVIVPVKVRENGSGGYELVYGHRRVEAARRAKLKEIPAIVENVNDTDAYAQGLIENRIREDMSAGDENIAIYMMVEIDELSNEEIGTRIGLSSGTIGHKYWKGKELIQEPEMAALFGVSIEVVEEIEQETGKDLSDVKDAIEDHEEEIAQDESNSDDVITEGFAMRDGHHQVVPSDGKWGLPQDWRVRVLTKAKQSELSINHTKMLARGIKVRLNYDDARGASARLRKSTNFSAEQSDNPEWLEIKFNLPKDPDSMGSIDWSTMPSVKGVIDYIKDFKEDVSDYKRVVKEKASPEAEDYVRRRVVELVSTLNAWAGSMREIQS